MKFLNKVILMIILIFFIIFGIYYFIGVKVANKIGTRDSYEQHIIACLFPIVLLIFGIINIVYFIKDRFRIR